MLSAVISVALAGSTELREAEWRRDVPALLEHTAAEEVSIRVEVARALGRTRDAAALDAVVELTRDTSPAVREQALIALAWLPGGAGPLRDQLQLLPRSSGWGAPETSAELRGHALWALGHHSDPADIDLLVAALGEGGPAAEGAATGLGRMGRDGVEGVQAALGPLLTVAERDFGSLPALAGYAAGRIGCDADHAPRAAARAKTAPRATTRAYLMRCAGKGLEPGERQTLAAAGLEDASSFVRVSALNLLQEGDLPGPAITALADGESQVRAAALAALTRLGSRQELSALASSDEPWLAAAAVEGLLAAGVEPDPAWKSGPIPVQAALAAHLPPPEARDLALSATDPVVRSSAASVLLGAELQSDDRVAYGRSLLASTDSVVRAVGVMVLADAEPAAALEVVGPAFRVETEPDVLGEMLKLIAADAESYEALPDGLATSVRRAAGLGHARLGRLAVDLAETLELPEPETQDDPRLDVKLEATAKVLGAVITTNRGSFRIGFESEVAPIAVWNFATLAAKGELDGDVFHRVVPGFVAQTGCPRGDGWGGPGYTIPDEVSRIRYDAGMVGMARSDRDTAGSQWFVTTTDQPHLTGDYTLFGRVTEGMPVVRAMEQGDQVLKVELELAK